MRNLCIALAALFLGVAGGNASEFPNRPVTIYVGSGAGGTLDVVIRTMAPKFLEQYGEPLVIINRPGAYGMLAAGAIIGSKPDGYALSTITPGAVDAMIDSKDPGYSPKKLSFVTGLVSFPLLVVVKEDGPKTIEELIVRKPEFWGTSNTIGWLAGDAILDAAGIDPRPQRVYYRGKDQEMLQEVIRGGIPFAVVNAPGAVGLIEGKLLRVIAVVAKKRSALFPDTPTVSEAFAQAGLQKPRAIREPAVALAAPAGISAQRRTRLAQAFQRILVDPDVQRALRRMSAEPTEWDSLE